MERDGVTGLFSSPTAIRLLMRYGEEVAAGGTTWPGWSARSRPARCSTRPPGSGCSRPSSRIACRSSTTCGRPRRAGRSSATRTATRLLPIKPGSAGVALPGIEADVVDQDGKPVGAGEKGIMRIKRPFPGLIATLWGEPERYVADYWERIPGGYYVGDAAHVDDDGYVWFAGRADEIIKIAGHRLGTIEVETAFLRHPGGRRGGRDRRPGRAPRRGHRGVRRAQGGARALRRSSTASCSRPSATSSGRWRCIGHLSIVAMLPKTRSGKIMRRVLKAVALERDPGDISTIEDEGSVDEARRAVEEMRAGIVT